MGVEQSQWFDLGDGFGDLTVRALLSQRNSGDAQRPAIEDHRAALTAELKLPPSKVATPQQVHAIHIEEAVPGAIHQACDGLFTRHDDTVLTLQVADCAPIFFLDPRTGWRGLVHAGWRGTAGGIIEASVAFMEERGCGLADIAVVVGPTIEKDCYEVGAEVVEHFPEGEIWTPNDHGRYQLSMAAAVKSRLLAAGIDNHNISMSTVCTKCDERCHSYRRDGDKAGRMIAYYYLEG